MTLPSSSRSRIPLHVDFPARCAGPDVIVEFVPGLKPTFCEMDRKIETNRLAFPCGGSSVLRSEASVVRCDARACPPARKIIHEAPGMSVPPM